MLIFIFCLQIPIFEKGYEIDPAVVAKEAIQEATRNGSDVVLVDTAGRMQVLFFDHLFQLLFIDSCIHCFKIVNICWSSLKNIGNYA